MKHGHAWIVVGRKSLWRITTRPKCQYRMLEGIICYLLLEPAAVYEVLV